MKFAVTALLAAAGGAAAMKVRVACNVKSESANQSEISAKLQARVEREAAALAEFKRWLGVDSKNKQKEIDSRIFPAQKRPQVKDKYRRHSQSLERTNHSHLNRSRTSQMLAEKKLSDLLDIGEADNGLNNVSDGVLASTFANGSRDYVQARRGQEDRKAFFQLQELAKAIVKRDSMKERLSRAARGWFRDFSNGGLTSRRRMGQMAGALEGLKFSW